MSRSVVLVLVVLAFGLTACFSGEPEFTPADQVAEADRPAETEAGEDGAGDDLAAQASATFVAIDNDFTEFPTEVAAGPTEFTLVNEGLADHNVIIVDPVEIEVVGTIAGGETASNVVDLAPGQYDYVCDIPGHAATMNGTLTVTE